MRTVLETEYSIDEIFDGQLDKFPGNLSSNFAEKYKEVVRAEKAKQAVGFMFKPFMVFDQNTATALYYREFPLPW